MENIRQQKMNRLLAKELSDIFRLEARESFQGAMITVTGVKISRDIAVAKVYLSVFLFQNKEELLLKIKENSREIRHKLGLRIKSQMRVVPELDFYLDDSLDYIENIDQLLKQ